MYFLGEEKVDLNGVSGKDKKKHRPIVIIKETTPPGKLVATGLELVEVKATDRLRSIMQQ
jgi:mRNA-degrading endonuclease toxin of MazEF toxin-antitoxin module